MTKLMNLRFTMGQFVIQREVVIITYKLETNVAFKGDHDLHILFHTQYKNVQKNSQNEFKFNSNSNSNSIVIYKNVHFFFKLVNEIVIYLFVPLLLPFSLYI